MIFLVETEMCHALSLIQSWNGISDDHTHTHNLSHYKVTSNTLWSLPTCLNYCDGDFPINKQSMQSMQ